MRGYKNFEGSPHPGDLRHRIQIGYTVNTINAIDAAGADLPALLQYYRSTPLYEQYAAESNAYTDHYEQENFLPQAFDALLRQRLAEAKR